MVRAHRRALVADHVQAMTASASSRPIRASATTAGARYGVDSVKSNVISRGLRIGYCAELFQSRIYVASARTARGVCGDTIIPGTVSI